MFAPTEIKLPANAVWGTCGTAEAIGTGVFVTDLEHGKKLPILMWH